MLMTKEKTESEIINLIEKGWYATEPSKVYTKTLSYTEETFILFKKDVVDFLCSKYGFSTNQSEIIFNRGWVDCSIGGLKSVLDEVIDIALFIKEIVQVA